MTFSVDPAVFDRYPALRVGLLAVRGADNAGAPEGIASLLREAEAQVRSSFDEQTFKDHPMLAAWQDAHRAFGSNPNKFPPSIQALVKRVLKGGELPSISPLVDLYNVISLRYALPAGGEDLDRIEGEIRLMFADGSEEFLPIGGEANDPPEPGEAISRDDRGVICRRFNWREGDRTKIMTGTRNAVLVLESLSSEGDHLQRALVDLEGLVQQFCGGASSIAILSSEKMAADC